MTKDYGYEIDMLPVGSGEKSGDAIALRYGNSTDGYKVMVVDGGTLESGDKLVEHIKKYYGTSRVDYMVCTHPDNDHSSGLRVVMEKMEVGDDLLPKVESRGSRGLRENAVRILRQMNSIHISTKNMHAHRVSTISTIGLAMFGNVRRLASC